MGKTELRQHGQHAAGFAHSPLARAESDAGEFHVLNSGKAYGGDIVLRGDIVIRDNPNRPGELIMLGDHHRGTILGAWTGARTEGEQVVADGMRFVSAEVEPQVSRYRGLLEEGVLWGVSIGFTGRWFYVPELPDSDPVKETGAVWLIEGTEEHPIEVYEASLVTIGADAESMVTYQFDAGDGAPAKDANLELEPEDERVVEGIAGSLMLRHLVDDHGMEPEAAEDAVRRMLAGEDADVIEDDDADDGDPEDGQMSEDAGTDDSAADGEVPEAVEDEDEEEEDEDATLSETPEPPPATFADFLSTVPEHPSTATFADFLAAGCS